MNKYKREVKRIVKMTTFTGRVYKLVHKDTMEMFYVGSTKQSLAKRMGQHRIGAGDPKQIHKPVYVKINEIGIENVKIILIEEIECQNRDQLLRKEADIIKANYDALTNKCIPLRTPAEWRIDNKDLIDERAKIYNNSEAARESAARWRKNNPEAIKKYREENADVIHQRQKEYRENNKDKLKEKYLEVREERNKQKNEYYQRNKEKFAELQKTYREEHKEELAIKNKEYRDANKAAINEKRRLYREKNKEKIKERKRLFYQANKDRLNKKSREYREANRDDILLNEQIYRDNRKKLAQQQQANN